MPDRRCSVVGIGEILWDMLPDGPRLGGAPFNATVHLRRFGCDATYVGAVGRDELGRRAIEEASRLGVDTSLIDVNEHPTGVVRVQLDPQGVPEYEIVSPAAYEAREPLRPNLAIDDAFDLVVFGTLAQRFDGVRAATRQIVDAGRGAARLYDVNLRPGCWDPPLVEQLLGLATVVKLNEDEQAVLAPALGLPDSPIERFARTACARYDLRAVCVTRGPSGAALLLDGLYREAPAPHVDVVDTVGAGDAFAAGLGYGLIRSWTVSEILSVATRLGAFVASRPGAVPEWEPAEIGIAEVRE
jgi:fructokinase